MLPRKRNETTGEFLRGKILWKSTNRTGEKPVDIMPRDIVDQVRSVLQNANRGKGDIPNYLTAFQILERLPPQLRDQLIAERGIGGRGCGTSYAAPSVVSDAAEMLGEHVKIEYMDSTGVSVQVAGQAVTPSNEVCALYRLS
jgi:hypothetical protein